jgi:hypothetical protein
MFILTKIEGGRINVPEPEYLVASTEIKSGAACTLNAAGALVAGTTKPTYITLAGGDAGAIIPVCRVEPNQVYEVETTSAPSALKAGSKVAIDSTAVKVSGTASESGVATVVATDGATVSGDNIRVRFV